jgi:hypothetical protein
MSSSNHFGSPEGFEHDFSQHVQRGEAIANAHSKLLEAKSKDNLLRSGDVQGSYRHVQTVVVVDPSGVERRHAKIMLVPSRDGHGAVRATGVVNMALEIPTTKWEEAPEISRNMYLANVSAQQVTEANLLESISVEPPYIPSQTIFGTATRADGTRISFVLGPDSLLAIASMKDVVPIEGEQAIGGQEYLVSASTETAELQTELEAEWFDEATLRDVIRDYEVVTFGGHASADSVA